MQFPLPTLLGARGRLRGIERRVGGCSSLKQFQPLVSVVILARNERQNIAVVRLREIRHGYVARLSPHPATFVTD
jgi:hypothetical protein